MACSRNYRDHPLHMLCLGFVSTGNDGLDIFFIVTILMLQLGSFTVAYECVVWLQYVITSERGLLRHAIQQLKKIPLKEQRGPQERLHLKTLQCRVDNEEISFLESFLSPIRSWADKQLGDYHLHFAEVLSKNKCVQTH